MLAKLDARLMAQLRRAADKGYKIIVDESGDRQETCPVGREKRSADQERLLPERVKSNGEWNLDHAWRKNRHLR